MSYQGWKFTKDGKKHTQDGPHLVGLMKGIGHGRRSVHAIDVGCGDGIIAFEILRQRKATSVVALDILKDAVETSSANLHNEILNGKAQVIKSSAQKMFKNRKLFGTFDRFVINPPFFPLNSGQHNKNKKDHIARHEASLKLKAWVKGASQLLKMGGELYCVFPTERLGELVAELSKNKLEPKEIWWFKSDLRKRRFFLRAMRDARPGLIVHLDFSF